MPSQPRKIAQLFSVFLCALLLGACNRTEENQLESTNSTSKPDWERKYRKATRVKENAQEDAERLQAEIDKLEQRLAAQSNRVSTLQKKVEGLENDSARWKTKYQDAQNGLQELKEKKASRRSEKVSTLSEQVQQLSTALNSSIQELIAAGQFQQAVSGLKSLIKIRPDDPMVLYRLAYSQEQLGANAKASRAYQKAIKAAQQNPTTHDSLLPRLYNNCGVVLMKRKQEQKALEWYEKAIEADKTYAPVYYNLGKLYMQDLQTPDKAITAFRKHIALGGSRGASAREAIKKLQGSTP